MNILILEWLYFKTFGQYDPERQKKGNAVVIENKRKRREYNSGNHQPVKNNRMNT